MQQFVLTIIDTPGFNDYRGAKRDDELVERIRNFFPELQEQGKGTIDAVCFVTRSQISTNQRYIFDSILSIFGKDVKDNIVVMATFADENEPPITTALNEANVAYTKMFKFNNSALFENIVCNRGNQSTRNWSLSSENFRNFITHFLQLPKRSLKLTSNVLDTRRMLTTIISGLKPLICKGLEDMNNIKKEKNFVNDLQNEMQENKTFVFKRTVNKSKKMDLEEGKHVTNCLTCSKTCHYPCKIPDNKAKEGCASMKNGFCTVCHKKCHWSKHKNNGYRIEWYEEEEEITNEDMKRKYDFAKNEKLTKEDMIRKMEEEYQAKHQNVKAMMEKARECINFLDENALKSSPLSSVESINLMIISEEEEKKPGFSERIEILEEFKQDAELIERAKTGIYHFSVRSLSLFTFLS